MTMLLENASATGSERQWSGGTGVFAVCGTLGGATVTLQFLGPDGTTWLAVGTDATLTAAGGGHFILPPGKVRALVSGGTPSGLFARVDQVYG
jgi:hypothetical protein